MKPLVVPPSDPASSLCALLPCVSVQYLRQGGVLVLTCASIYQLPTGTTHTFISSPHLLPNLHTAFLFKTPPFQPSVCLTSYFLPPLSITSALPPSPASPPDPPLSLVLTITGLAEEAERRLSVEGPGGYPGWVVDSQQVFGPQWGHKDGDVAQALPHTMPNSFHAFHPAQVLTTS